MTTMIMGVFTARYHGSCALPSCERGGEILQGDAAQYVDEQLVHMVCARRIQRGQIDPLCTDCYTYHVGICP